MLQESIIMKSVFMKQSGFDYFIFNFSDGRKKRIHLNIHPTGITCLRATCLSFVYVGVVEIIYQHVVLSC